MSTRGGFVPPAGAFVLPGMAKHSPPKATSSPQENATGSSSGGQPVKASNSLKTIPSKERVSNPGVQPSPPTSSASTQNPERAPRPTPPNKPKSLPSKQALKAGTSSISAAASRNASRLQSLAFVNECPPLFKQGVECGRKAVIKELEYEYEQALKLYYEALEAFSHITVGPEQVKSAIAQKTETYNEKIKTLEARLAIVNEPDVERSESPTASEEAAVVAAVAAVAAPIVQVGDNEPIPESAFPEKNKVFHELFKADGVALSEVLVTYFSCSFEDKSESGLGQMYITNNLICFAGSFNQQLKRVIKMTEIREITRRMLRVEIHLHTGDLVTFKGLVSVGSCFNVLTKLLYNCKVVFGVPLKDLLKKEGRLNEGIPLAIEALIESLSIDDLLETEGIFRISACVTDVDVLVATIDRGTAAYHKEDVHTKACALKMFFRKLPEPLLTFALYDSFLAILDSPDPQQQFATAKLVISKLPPENAKLLFYLLKFLYTACLHSQYSKMTTDNISIVFGPILLRSSDPDFDKILKETAVVNDVVNYLLQQYCQLAIDLGL